MARVALGSPAHKDRVCRRDSWKPSRLAGLGHGITITFPPLILKPILRYGKAPARRYYPMPPSIRRRQAWP
jgi:hypothetical protein